jgi:hypothetical protein
MRTGRPLTMDRHGTPPAALLHAPTCRCHAARGCAGHLWPSLVDQSGKAWHVDPMCNTARSAEIA